MTMLRVRIEVADRPGALAGVTSALAALGVDVASIDVLEVDGATVVDELVLRLPAKVSGQEVWDVLRLAGAAQVLSSAAEGPVVDPAVAAIELARSVLAAPGDAGAPGRALARSAYADVGQWVDVADARRYPLAERALGSGVPASGPAGPDASPLAVPSGRVLWVAPQLPDPQRLAVVGRRLEVRFSATEAARLRAFATLLETLERVQA
ncbi:MAG TPA: ACT domain-containing protein [Mycobacteriales bacterium]|nr:ACT domain-containing protein [Mycobacteriales bacterium]